MERAGIRAADIHAWAPPHRFQALEDLDCRSVVIVGRRSGTGSEKIGHF
jgi:hypothetical protein